MRVWSVSSSGLTVLLPTQLDREERLESWLAADLEGLLGIGALVIGRQIATAYGGRIDLLAVDQQGRCLIIEVKRDRTPRDVIAQALDYASWVRTLKTPDLEALFSRDNDGLLRDAFHKRFDEPMPADLNPAHRIIIVAGSLDPASRRIVEYLSEEAGIDINTAFFSFFKHGEQEYLSADWLLDPEMTEERAEAKTKPAWSGYWFVNAGPDPNRNWEVNRKYGYVGAGGAPRYSDPLRQLESGDKIFAYRKTPGGGERGYVGFGEVGGKAMMPSDTKIDGIPFFDLPIDKQDFENNSNDPDLANWVLPVRWRKTVHATEARRFKGAFANQHIVCKLRDPVTIDFLMKEFTSV